MNAIRTPAMPPERRLGVRAAGARGSAVSAYQLLRDAVRHQAFTDAVVVGRLAARVGVWSRWRADKSIPDADSAVDTSTMLPPSLPDAREPEAVDQQREQRALVDVEQRLQRRFPTVDAVVVEAAVRLAHAELTGPVRDYVPLLVERRARERLASVVDEAPGGQVPSS